MHADVEKLLRDKGFKATPQRIRLIEALQEAKKPLSVEQVIRLLSKKADQATVYRGLEAFAGSGLVRRVNLGHAHAHYELNDPDDHHHHLVCEGCGRTEDVEVPEPKNLEAVALKKSKQFKTVSFHSMEFFGICKKCQ